MSARASATHEALVHHPRRAASGPPSRAGARVPGSLDLMDLQASAGNAAVTALLAGGGGDDVGGGAALGTVLTRLEGRAGSAASGLVAPLRPRLEDALGTGLGDIAVHTDPEAAALTDAVGARALSVGRHLLFGAGRYAPHTEEGQALVAHEVVHSVAARSGGRAPHAGAEQETDRAGARAAAGLRTGIPRAAGAVGRKGAREPVAPAAPVVKMYSYRAPDGSTVELPEPAYLAQRAAAIARLRGDARRVAEGVGYSRATHVQFLDDYHVESFSDVWHKPSRLIGVAINVKAGVVPPHLSMWDTPLRLAHQAMGTLDAGDLDKGARLTGRAREALTDAQRRWSSFIGTSTGAAAELAGQLETIRNVSFGIAIAAAAVLAAPIVAGGVAAAGATGLGATALTAAGTGLVTGAAGFGLRTTADVAGQAATGGKVDVGKSALSAAKELPSDIATGATAGAAPGIGRLFGLGARGLTTGGTLARNAAVHGGLAAGSGVVETGVDTARALAVEGKSLREATAENIVPGLKRTAVGTVGAVLTSPLGPAGQKLAGAGRPGLGAAVTHVGGAAGAAGITLAAGGSREDAAKAALHSVVVSGSLAAARQPVTAARAAAPARPVTREELPPGVAANDTHPLLRPVEAAEVPAAGRVANDNADVVQMTGTGPVVTAGGSAPSLSGPPRASSGTPGAPPVVATPAPNGTSTARPGSSGRAGGPGPRAVRPRTPEDEHADFIAAIREEGSSGPITVGEPVSMQPHSAARRAREALELGSEHESAHGLPRSVGRHRPGYDPGAALTTLQDRVAHTDLDQPWKTAFQDMRRQGRTTATGQEVYDTLVDSIDRSSTLSPGLKETHKRRLHDEMFVEYGIDPAEPLTLPYANIKAAP